MADEPELELPHGIALAWGVAANPQRGPKRELSVERIVDAAIEIADSDGLGAVSMASVASRLGFTTMSLYRYVSAKDDLVLLMLETGIGVAPASLYEIDDWREGLVALAREVTRAYLAHPWMLDIPIEGAPNTPNQLTWLDAALAILGDTPLTEAERVAATLMVSSHVRWHASIERGYEKAIEAAGTTPSEHEVAEARLIASLVTEEQFPNISRASAAGAFTGTDDPFAFGLARILDGLERYIERVAVERPAKPEQPGLRDPDARFAKDPAVRQARQAVREAEQKLREAKRREREALKRARERAKD